MNIWIFYMYRYVQHLLNAKSVYMYIQLLWGVWKFSVLTSSHFLVCNVNSVHCVFYFFFLFCVSLLLYPFAPSFIFSILSVFPSVLPPLRPLPLPCVSGRWGLILLLLIFSPGPSSGGEVCVCLCVVSLLYCHSQTGQGAFFPIKLIYCQFFFPLNFLSYLCKSLWKHNGGFHSKWTATYRLVLSAVLLRTQETTMMWPVSPPLLISIAALINRKYTTSLSNKILSVFCRH